MTGKQDIYLFCPECDRQVRSENWVKHMYMQHGAEVDLQVKSFLQEARDGGEWVTCAECDLEMKKRNLRRHLRKVHGLHALAEQEKLVSS